MLLGVCCSGMLKLEVQTEDLSETQIMLCPSIRSVPPSLKVWIYILLAEKHNAQHGP